MTKWTVHWMPADPVEAATAEDAARLMYERMTMGVEKPVFAVLEDGFSTRETQIVDLDSIDLADADQL